MEKKESGVLLKQDISRASDSVSWGFLLAVLRRFGFLEPCVRWFAIALRTASTKILVNGYPGKKIVHACGLRQGDPVSPQLC
jgi:hypothetical protein